MNIMCVIVLCLLLFTCSGDRMQASSSACKSERPGFSDWMSFLPSNLKEEISPNTEALSANT